MTLVIKAGSAAFWCPEEGLCRAEAGRGALRFACCKRADSGSGVTLQGERERERDISSFSVLGVLEGMPVHVRVCV